MSTKTSWWTVAATSTLLCASAAHADLLGLDYELVGVNYITGPNAPAGDHFTVDVFAIIDSGDRLDAVAGDENVDKIVSAQPTGSFYQSPFGANTSAGINPALFGSFPSVQYDSFVTIGLIDQVDNAMSDQGIDFSQFQTGGDIYADNGAWYVTPVDPQGAGQAFTAQDCSQQTAVRVARLTVNGLDTTIHLEALFQGKDSAGVTWTGNGGVDISYAPITDCNENGVADECDIANGDSDDTNENGVPDECDNFDCNDNGQDDADDIADGTSSDCNGNGVPDECDVADGTSADCNGNGVPDECESDCNGNGIPDECDVDGGSSEDCDGDGTPDECEPDSDGDGIIDDCEVPPNYVNLDNGGVYEFFADAIADADDGDRIEGLAEAVNSETEMNFNETCVNFSVADEVDTNAEVFLASCGTMEVGTNAFFNNNVYSGVGGTYRIEAAGNLEFFDMLIVRSGATVETDCINGTDVNGFTLRPNSMLTASQAIIMDSGTATMFEGSMIESLLTNNGGMFNAQGTILSAVINWGQMNVIDDLFQIGNLDNGAGATIDIWRGVYYVIGDITNDGTINGDIDQGPGRRGGDDAQPGDGFNVSGNYTAGSEARLTMPHEYWAVRIGGHVNLAIDDSSRFHMSLAELHATGRDGGIQDIEVMGTDLGNTEDGLEQGVAGNYPLGTLRIDGMSSARLVDTHDNDTLGQDAGEAFYCDTLVVDGHLDTNGYKVYANEIVINGTVSDEDDVIIIDPPVLGDLNGDSIVDVLDLLVVIADWGECPGECTAADLNDDGVVDVLDLLIILQEWS